jgi:transcriptional regulator with XRE-family HTH domain
MNCPSLLELTSADLERKPQLAEHLEKCERCRALFAAWQREPLTDDTEPQGVPEAPLVWAPRSNPDAGAGVGAIHAVAAPGLDLYLLAFVVDLDDEQATIFPISDETHWAGDWDVIVDDELLGYPVLVEAWNTCEVARAQLREPLAVAADPLRESLLALYDRALAGEPAGDEVLQGPPLEHPSDPRHLFRERERERIARYNRQLLGDEDEEDNEPADVAEQARDPERVLAQTLGEFVRGVREARGRELREIADEVDFAPASLARLERDEEDLRAHIPVASFIRLLSKLDIEPSDELYALTEQAATDNDRTPAAQRAPIAARRRSGLRARAAQAPEPVRRARAREYIEQLRARLEGR